MNFETIRQLIAGHFKDNWDESWLPVIYENQQEKPRTAAWGRLAILQGDVLPATIGNQGFYRGTGLAVLQIFVPEGGGTATFNTAAEHFAEIFNLARLSDPPVFIRFDAVGMMEAAKTAGFLQRHARVVFSADSNP